MHVQRVVNLSSHDSRFHRVSNNTSQQSMFRRSGTVVVLAIDRADYRLDIVSFMVLSALDEKSKFSVFWEEVWSQGQNSKELTKRHHQEWSTRLNLTQHLKLTKSWHSPGPPPSLTQRT